MNYEFKVGPDTDSPHGQMVRFLVERFPLRRPPRVPLDSSPKLFVTSLPVHLIQ